MKNYDFIPHAANTRSCSQVINLIEAEGAAGYGFYWALLEYLRAQPRYTGDIRAIKNLARQLRIRIDKALRVLNDYDLFVVNKIDFYYEDCSFVYKGKIATRNWINRAVKENNKQLGAISIIFCSDNYLLKINQDYLNHDYFTDISTFDYCEGNSVSGDLFISIDMIRANAEKFGVEFIDELHRVIIHGVMHLVGFKDKTEEEAQTMRAQENYWLERFS